MTDEVKSVLSDADKELIKQYNSALATLRKTIENTYKTVMVIQKTVKATLGSQQYWADESVRHINLGMLSLQTALDVEPTMPILLELRKRKAEMDAEAKALEEFNKLAADPSPQLGGDIDGSQMGGNINTANLAEIAKKENLPAQDNAEGQAISPSE